MKKLHVLIPSLVATASMPLVGLVGCGDPTPPGPILPTNIILNESSITLNKNETFTLVATILPQGATCDLIWTSSLKSVATVDNGVVTAIGPGDAVITVQAVGFESVTATCNVHVDVPIVPEIITLDQKHVSLDQGGTATLVATVDPPEATCDLEWTSSEESVATINDGLITAINPGNTVITVQAVGYDVEATCSVHVNTPDPDDPEEIILSTTEFTRDVGDVYALDAIVKPEGFECELIWTSSDESVATVHGSGDDATVHCLNPGHTIITVKIVNHEEIQATCSVHVRG